MTAPGLLQWYNINSSPAVISHLPQDTSGQGGPAYRPFADGPALAGERPRHELGSSYQSAIDSFEEFMKRYNYTKYAINIDITLLFFCAAGRCCWLVKVDGMLRWQKRKTQRSPRVRNDTHICSCCMPSITQPGSCFDTGGYVFEDRTWQKCSCFGMLHALSRSVFCLGREKSLDKDKKDDSECGGRIRQSAQLPLSCGLRLYSTAAATIFLQS